MLAEGKISLVTLHSKYKAFCDRPAQLGGVPFEQVPFDAFDTQLKLCGLEVFQDPTERKEMVAGVVSVAQEAPPQIVETAQVCVCASHVLSRMPTLTRALVCVAAFHPDRQYFREGL